MEPMIAWARAVRPPIAMPWTTRAVSSSGMVSDRPAMTDPATKITMLSWTRTFLSNRSASLPQIGVVAALASSAAVMTQAKSVCVPLSSDMMVGSALATMVLLRIAVKKAARSPVRASMICRCVMGAWGEWAAGRGVAVPETATWLAMDVLLAFGGVRDGAGRRCPGGFPKGFREFGEYFRRLLGVLLAPVTQEFLHGGHAMVLDVDQFCPAGVGQGHQLRPPVVGIGPAVDQPELLQLRDVPAEARSADSQACGEVGGP